MGDYYVYEHWRPDKNVCFYVGKGKRTRAFNKARNNRYNNIRRKLKRQGLEVEIIIVKDKLSEAQAFRLEIQLIKHYGRLDCGTGELANCTDGGDGTPGKKVSEETRRKISAKSIEHMSRPESKAAIAESNRRRVHSKSTCEKLSIAAKSQWTKERRAKHQVTAAKIWSDAEFRERRSKETSEMNKKRWQDEDYRTKMTAQLRAMNKNKTKGGQDAR